MDKLLDKEVNTQYKAPSLVTYLNSRSSSSAAAASSSFPTSPNMSSASAAASAAASYPHSSSSAFPANSSVHDNNHSRRNPSLPTSRPHSSSGATPCSVGSMGRGDPIGIEVGGDAESSNDVTPTQSLPSSNSGSTCGLLSGSGGGGSGAGGVGNSGGARPKTTYSLRYNR